MPVEMIPKEEHVREPGAGGKFLGPGSIRQLRRDQILETAANGEGTRVTRRREPEQRPCRLRRSAGRRNVTVADITRAALAPSTVRVLDRSQPIRRLAHGRFRRGASRGAQSAQRKKGSVDVGHTPSAV